MTTPPDPQTEPAPRPVDASDLDWMLRLNQAHVRELSALGRVRLAELVERAAIAAVVDPAAGFLMVFDQRADYDSANFLWFRDRYPDFLYVDRIVVDAAARGRGVARALYGHLFACAAGLGHTRIVCEVNADPPNPGSDAFHARLGFETVGHAALSGAGKTVRYLCKPLAP